MLTSCRLITSMVGWKLQQREIVARKGKAFFHNDKSDLFAQQAGEPTKHNLDFILYVE